MTTNEPQVTRPPVDIAIACYPGAQATCIHGLTDLFSYAEYFARTHTGTAGTFLRVTHWRPNDSGEIECSFNSHPGPARKPALVIVPACQLAPHERGIAPTCIAWVRSRHAEGAIVAAVCGGMFLLADSGLLDGRRATAHWMFADELRRRFPQLDVDHDRVIGLSPAEYRRRFQRAAEQTTSGR